MKVKLLVFTICAIILSSCGNRTSEKYEPKKESFDEKIKQGRNTGTPADIYNRNPYSVFDTYSPWNPVQNP